MNNIDIFKEIGLIDKDLIIQSRDKKNNKKWVLRASLIAASFVLVILIFSVFYTQNITLKNSEGNVNVNIINNPFVSFDYSEFDLEPLSEKDIINPENNDIIKGNVVDISNIKVEIEKEIYYRSIIKIKTDVVYDGNIKNGDVISVLCPSFINGFFWVEDTQVISQIEKGMNGIFILYKYTNENYIKINNSKFYYTDVAEYGFSDGERCAFLETKKGLIYYKNAFHSIKNPKTLEDIERYIIKMVE